MNIDKIKENFIKNSRWKKEVTWDTEKSLEFNIEFNDHLQQIIKDIYTTADKKIIKYNNHIDEIDPINDIDLFGAEITRMNEIKEIKQSIEKIIQGVVE